MPSHSRADRERGSVTAELVVAIPAVLLVVATCLAMMQIAAQQVRYTDAAAVGARSLARGESDAVAAERAMVVSGPARFASVESGDFVCATVTGRAVPVLTSLLGVDLEASSCSLAGGL